VDGHALNKKVRKATLEVIVGRPIRKDNLNIFEWHPLFFGKQINIVGTVVSVGSPRLLVWGWL
jgi:hypothetical protein